MDDFDGVAVQGSPGSHDAIVEPARVRNKHAIGAREGENGVARNGKTLRVRIHSDNDFGKRARAERSVLIRNLAFNDERPALGFNRRTEPDNAAVARGQLPLDLHINRLSDTYLGRKP